MPDFPLDSSGYKYRALKEGARGWDVYSLQSALHAVDFGTGGWDGVFGPATHQAVCDYQAWAGLTVDGIAGAVTQRSLALKLGYRVTKLYGLPTGAMKGHVEAESAYLWGNHSLAYYQKDASGNSLGPFYDVGIAQHSSRYTSLDDGFNGPLSLDKMGKNTRRKYDLYKSWGVVRDERRLWELAMGSWNAPAWTDRLAKGQSLSTSQKQWIEDYIARVSVYLEA